MKNAVPLTCAWYLHERPLPPDFTTLVIVVTAVALPALLIADSRTSARRCWSPPAAVS
jgi:hypothetical protein